MNLLHIEWSVSPILLDLGFMELRWYSLFFGLGIVAAYGLANKVFRQAAIAQSDFEKLSLWVIIGGVAGARLGHCLFYDFAYFSQHPLEIFLPWRFSPEFQFIGYQGLASHGGAIGILLALVIAYYQLPAIRMWFVLDVLALVIPLCGACIRLGNLMNSEMIGKVSDANWAVVFPMVDTLPRHPTQLYEAGAYLLIFSLLNLTNRRFPHLKEGFLFAWFLILLFSARFWIEFFKENQVPFEQNLWLNMGQILSMPFIILGIVVLIIKTRPEKNQAIMSR